MAIHTPPKDETIVMTEDDLALLTTAMPADTNPAGDIFGGWMMAQMDLGAGSVAQRFAKGRCVTIAVDAFQFHVPVHVGDEVSVYARIVHVGRTSLKLKVIAYRRLRFGEDKQKVTEAFFTFVALDENAKPRAILRD
jgi:acyl-CoA thioesterase YciA